MKNLKFGAIFLGLALVVGLMAGGVSAQGPSTRERRPSADVFSFAMGGPQLGVRLSDLDAKAATPGVKIENVHAGSAAEKAGIKAGDVIVEYDGEKVRSARQLTRLVQETADGRAVSIALMRDGKRQTVTATPDARRAAWDVGPDVERAMREAERGVREAERGLRDFHFDMPMPPAPPRPPAPPEARRFEFRAPERMRSPRARLGVTLQPLTRDLEDYFGAKNGGALVSSVTPDSAASKAGIKAGDVITSINGHSVRDAGDVMEEVADASGEVTIQVVRDKREVTVKALIDKPKGLPPRDQ